MNFTKRNLLVGLAGMAVLLIGILVYAQVNAAHTFDLSEFPRQME